MEYDFIEMSGHILRKACFTHLGIAGAPISDWAKASFSTNGTHRLSSSNRFVTMMIRGCDISYVSGLLPTIKNIILKKF